MKNVEEKIEPVVIILDEEDDFDFTGRFSSLTAEFEQQLQEEAHLNALIQEQLAKVVVGVSGASIN